MSIEELLIKIDELKCISQSIDDAEQSGISSIIDSIREVFDYFKIEMPIDSVDKQMCYSDICRRVENLYVSLKKGQYESILSDICILLDKLDCSIKYYLM